MRIIDADALKKIFDADEEEKKISYNIFVVNNKIDSAPTIEERKGIWIQLLNGSIECSECYVEQPIESHYCPWCGAKMEG